MFKNILGNSKIAFVIVPIGPNGCIGAVLKFPETVLSVSVI